MGGAGDHAGGAVVHERLRRAGQRARGVDHVVDDDALLALHVADEVHDLRDVGALTTLVDDGEARIQALRVGARALHAAGVGRHHDRGGVEIFLQVLLEHDGHAVEVIEWQVEEALDLSGVEVDRHDAIDAGRLDEVRDELRRDGRARGDLPVLARVAVVRDDRGDGGGGGTTERVRDDQQLHHVIVHGAARRLDHEGVHAADVLVDLDEGLAIAEALDLDLTERSLEVRGDVARELGVGVAGKEADLLEQARAASLAVKRRENRGFDWRVT